jgi:hypothetical protein
LSLSLSILYVASRLCGCPLTLTHLLSLVSFGKIPYLAAFGAGSDVERQAKSNLKRAQLALFHITKQIPFLGFDKAELAKQLKDSAEFHVSQSEQVMNAALSFFQKLFRKHRN